MSKKKSRQLFGIICVLPATILLAIFMIYPTSQVFYLSLFKMGGFSPVKEFVGFENFQYLINDMKFVQAFQNTILMVVVVTIITMSLSILYAAILSRETIKGQNFFRIIFYIPNIFNISHRFYPCFYK